MAVAIAPVLKFSIHPFVPGLERAGLPHLNKNEVQIWFLGLNGHDASLPDLQNLLSSEERERAARFRFEKHRDQFVLTRGALRLLLASHLAASPRQISFRYSSHGKPCLTAPANGPELDFNVSHTEGMAILGFTRGRRIGVDIEQLRRDFRVEEIAERFFSLAERAALREIPAERIHETFFRIWTRKEAYIKARGEGLSHPLHQFDVSLDDTARLLATRPDASQTQSWQLENLEIAPGYAAAAAVETCGAQSTAG